jgi:hypothetical protein
MLPDQVTVAEIAEALGKTVQWVRMLSDQRSWPYTIANKRGDRRFDLKALPPDIRTAVKIHRVAKAHTPKSPPARLPAPTTPADRFVDLVERALYSDRLGQVIIAFLWLAAGYMLGLIQTLAR